MAEQFSKYVNHPAKNNPRGSVIFKLNNTENVCQGFGFLLIYAVVSKLFTNILNNGHNQDMIII